MGIYFGLCLIDIYEWNFGFKGNPVCNCIFSKLFIILFKEGARGKERKGRRKGEKEIENERGERELIHSSAHPVVHY